VRPTRAVLAAVTVALLAACASAPAVPEGDAADDAAAATGCDLETPGWDGSTEHLSLDEAPPADELYDSRPAHGGPHTPEWLVATVYDAPVEERAAVHNLEHGAVAIWYSPDLDDEVVAPLIVWAEERNAAGLLDEDTGAGILVAPWHEDIVPTFNFRAWGVLAGCEAFNEEFADAFVLDHFGRAGVAPEGELGRDPSEVISVPTDA
jgi:hypothetical protein